jgi:hypothetical protein
MLFALTPRLPFALRLCGAAAARFFHIVAPMRNYRFSLNFLRNPGFFERSTLHRIVTISRHTLRAFASSRETNQAATRAVRLQVIHAKAQRPRRNVAPHFHIFTPMRNGRYSLNFLRNPRFFEKGTLHKIITYSHHPLRAVAPSRQSVGTCLERSPNPMPEIPDE